MRVISFACVKPKSMQTSVHSIIVIAALTLVGLSLLIQGYRLSKVTSGFLGSSTIPKPWFLLGKFSLFSTWALMLVKAADPSIDWWNLFPSLPWTAVAFLLPGSFITGISFFHLGISLKVGLPERKDTELKTKGFYSFSRNPLYLGVYLITFSSMLYFPALPNLVLGTIGIMLHHRITLGEEKFLSERFGREYEEYKKKVRRYI